jgi:hypothetical protein
MKSLLLWLFSAGKPGKLVVTGGSMLISVFVYGLVFGVPYTIGFVAVMFLHEMQWHVRLAR